MRARYAEQSAESRRAHEIEVKRFLVLWKRAIEAQIETSFGSPNPISGFIIYANRFTPDYAEPGVWEAAVGAAQYFKEQGFVAVASNGRRGPPSVEVSWAED